MADRISQMVSSIPRMPEVLNSSLTLSSGVVSDTWPNIACMVAL